MLLTFLGLLPWAGRWASKAAGNSWDRNPFLRILLAPREWDAPRDTTREHLVSREHVVSSATVSLAPTGRPLPQAYHVTYM